MSRSGKTQLKADGSSRRKKAAWPPSAKKHKVALPEFERHLKDIGTGDSHIGPHVLGAGRFLEMIESTSEDKAHSPVCFDQRSVASVRAPCPLPTARPRPALAALTS